jgi:hypothetical protein
MESMKYCKDGTYIMWDNAGIIAGVWAMKIEWHSVNNTVKRTKIAYSCTKPFKTPYYRIKESLLKSKYRMNH